MNRLTFVVLIRFFVQWHFSHFPFIGLILWYGAPFISAAGTWKWHEKAIEQLGWDNRRKYAQSLLDWTTGKKASIGSPLAFGEKDTKERIRNIMSYQHSRWWGIVAVILVLAALCIGLALNPPKAQDNLISFPAYQDGKTEYNKQIYSIQPFTLHISLPTGWSTALPLQEERGESPAGFTPVYLMENDTIKAVVSFNTFELYEDEIPSEDFYKTVYAPLRLCPWKI